MKKLLSIFIILFYILLGPVPTVIYSASATPAPTPPSKSCSVTTDPNPVTPATKTIKLTLSGVGIASGDYAVKLNDQFIGHETGTFTNSFWVPAIFRYDGTNLIVPKINHKGDVGADDGSFAPGPYSVSLYQGTNSLVCSTKFSVANSISYGACKINFDKTTIAYTDPIGFSVSGFSDDKASTVHVELHSGQDTSDNSKLTEKEVPKDQANSSYSFPARSAGTYSIILKRGCSVDQRFLQGCDVDTPVCNQSFCVGTTDSSGKNSCGESSVLFTPQDITFIGQGGQTIKPPQIPCATALNSDLNCTSVPSGLGFSIPTDAPAFAATIMGLFLAIGGAILLFIIIITGYRLMASQGDPEKVKAAREQLTGAIAGLIFMIFSIAILAFIGINVIHIPGFK